MTYKKQKVKWIGNIVSGDLSAIKFIPNYTLGYEYNSDFTSITATTDDNIGKIPDTIQVSATPLYAVDERVWTIHFTQECEGECSECDLIVKQTGNTTPGDDETRTICGFDSDEGIRVAISGTELSESAVTFNNGQINFVGQIKPIYEVMKYYSGTTEPYEGYPKYITADTWVDKTYEGSWELVSGTTYDSGDFGTVYFSSTTKARTLGNQFTYSGQSATGIINQTVDTTPVDYYAYVNLPGVTVKFLDKNGEIVSSVTATNSSNYRTNFEFKASTHIVLFGESGSTIRIPITSTSATTPNSMYLAICSTTMERPIVEDVFYTESSYVSRSNEIEVYPTSWDLSKGNVLNDVIVSAVTVFRDIAYGNKSFHVPKKLGSHVFIDDDIQSDSSESYIRYEHTLFGEYATSVINAQWEVKDLPNGISGDNGTSSTSFSADTGTVLSNVNIKYNVKNNDSVYKNISVKPIAKKKEYLLSFSGGTYDNPISASTYTIRGSTQGMSDSGAPISWGIINTIDGEMNYDLGFSLTDADAEWIHPIYFAYDSSSMSASYKNTEPIALFGLISGFESGNTATSRSGRVSIYRKESVHHDHSLITLTVNQYRISGGGGSNTQYYTASIKFITNNYTYETLRNRCIYITESTYGQLTSSMESSYIPFGVYSVNYGPTTNGKNYCVYYIGTYAKGSNPYFKRNGNGKPSVRLVHDNLYNVFFKSGSDSNVKIGTINFRENQNIQYEINN